MQMPLRLKKQSSDSGGWAVPPTDSSPAPGERAVWPLSWSWKRSQTSGSAWEPQWAAPMESSVLSRTS